MTQQIKLDNRTMLIASIAFATILAGLTFQNIANAPCDEMGCLFKIIALPATIAVLGITFLILWQAHKYSTKKHTTYWFVPALSIILGVTIVSSVSLDMMFMILLMFFKYILNYWWVVLILGILPILIIKRIKTEDQWKRYWSFLVVLAIIPGLINGVLYAVELPNTQKQANEVFDAFMKANNEASMAVTQKAMEIEQKAVQANDPEMCDGQFRDRCLMTIAGQTDDITLCERIWNQATQTACYENFALKTNNPELCKGLVRERCISQIALTTRQPELCEGLQASMKDNCLYSIAEATHDKTLCGMMSKLGKSRQWKNCYQVTTDSVEECLQYVPDEIATCTWNIASRTQNIELCDTLTAEEKNICIRQVQNAAQKP